MEKIAIGILTAIIISFLSSWITVQLSLRRFRSERWWEKRADAYSKIIEALHNSKAFLEEHLEWERVDAYPKIKKVKEALHNSKVFQHLEVEAVDGNLTVRKKELGLRAHAANDEITKAVNVGAFLLSEKALTCLKQYKEDTAMHPGITWDAYLEQNFSATKVCLEAIIKIAKKDLAVVP